MKAQHKTNSTYLLEPGNLLGNIAEGVAAFTGEAFFTSLVEYLAESLNVEYAHIGEISGAKFNRIRTLAAYGRGKILQNFDYDLAPTPCKELTSKKSCIYSREVQKHFPRNPHLLELDIQSYIAISLIDSSERVIGILVLMDRRPLPHGDFAKSVLQIFAVRAAAELERIRTEAKRRESEQKYRLVVQNADEAILVVQQGKIKFFNPRTVDITGIAEDQLAYKTFLDLIHPEDRKRVASHLNTVRRTGQSEKLESFRIVQPDHSVRWLDASSVYLTWGRQPATLCFLIDVTRRKSLQEELARTQRLESAGRVAGQIAHDFNNLLSPLSAYPALIREELPADSSILRMLAEIERSADKLAEINQQLLTLGKRCHYAMDPVNLNELIHETLHACCLPKEILIKEQLTPDLLPVKGGAAQLHRAFSNLIHNAVEAMRGKGILRVETENIYLERPPDGNRSMKRGDYVKLQISDTGSGIAPDILHKVFDPFFTTKKMNRERGSGLGLSVVHSIVEDHHGYITLDSKVGKGTTFSILFPAARKLTRQTPEIRKTPQRGSERILVVDDDPVQRRVSGQLLKRLGYKVHVLSSGEHAVKHVKTRSYDLLIMDMVMEGMDGVEAYRRILELNPQQKAIIVSGYAMSSRVQQAMKLGAGSFVPKPVTQKTLAEAVRRELDRKSRRKHRLN
ncbi:MAG: response regulator [bacterium]